MELLFALLIIAAGVGLFAAVMTQLPKHAEEHIAAEKWLRETAGKEGRSRDGKGAVPMPREHLRPLVEIIDGLLYELQQAQKQLDQARTQPAQPASPVSPAAPQPAPMPRQEIA